MAHGDGKEVISDSGIRATQRLCCGSMHVMHAVGQHMLCRVGVGEGLHLHAHAEGRHWLTPRLSSPPASTIHALTMGLLHCTAAPPSHPPPGALTSSSPMDASCTGSLVSTCTSWGNIQKGGGRRVKMGGGHHTAERAALVRGASQRQASARQLRCALHSCIPDSHAARCLPSPHTQHAPSSHPTCTDDPLTAGDQALSSAPHLSLRSTYRPAPQQGEDRANAAAAAARWRSAPGTAAETCRTAHTADPAHTPLP